MTSYYLGHLIPDITYQRILLWQTVLIDGNFVDVVCYMLSVIINKDFLIPSRSRHHLCFETGPKFEDNLIFPLY